MSDRPRRDSTVPAVNRRSVAPADPPRSSVTPPIQAQTQTVTEASVSGSLHRREAAFRLFRAVSALTLLVMVILGGRAVHRWMHTTPRFGARDILIDGAQRTSRADVLRASGITESTNVLSIDPPTIERSLQALPWVAHATVRRRLPDHITITLEERTAAAVVSVGGLYLSSPDGTLFKRLEPGDPIDLPVLTGLSREVFRDDPDAAHEQVRDALALVADLASVRVGRALHLSEVHREPNGDLSMVLDGTYVWLGSGPYRAKLTRLRVVLAELRHRGLDATEVHLETDRHPERVTVRATSRVAAHTAERRRH